MKSHLVDHHNQIYNNNECGSSIEQTYCDIFPIKKSLQFDQEGSKVLTEKWQLKMAVFPHSKDAKRKIGHASIT